MTDQRHHTDWQRKALTKLMELHYTIQYKKGVNNGAADALSRKAPASSELFAISTVQPLWLSLVERSYVEDARAQSLLQQLAVAPGSVEEYTLENGILRHRNRVWIGSDAALQKQIISAFHDSPQGGHSGFPVTYRKLLSLFSWPGMKSMVHEYVRSYRICQQAKPERLPPAGLLQPLPVPSAPWEMATMDFIEGLPHSNQFSCILVVVDKQTKYAHFIPLRHPYTASKIAELFVDNVYKLHGMPGSLVSDHDPVLTSTFWQAVFRATGTQLRLSTANHPETDGQTERVNQSIECYLRCFISAHPQQWSKWLSLCEFWYNTNWHASTGKTPFELLYGRHPRYFGICASDQIAPVDVQVWLQERALVLDSVQQHLLRMQQHMNAQADKHRTERSFEVSDEVFLRLQPYIQSSVARRANHKLAFKFFGPFRVLARVGAVAYRLELAPSSRVHPVFHVSQLKACIGDRPVTSALPAHDAVFQVPMRVLRQRQQQRGARSVTQALVQWSGTAEADATWEDLEQLRQAFPRAPAWGQAGFEEEGIVNDLTPPASDGDTRGPARSEGRPRRKKKAPAWLAGGNYVT